MHTKRLLRAAKTAALLTVAFFMAAAVSGRTAFAAAPAATQAAASSAQAASPGKREHLIFLQGSPQELEVFRIQGRFPGPTVMLLGGIHGDERGAYLSADHFTDASVKKGTLIVVPRANFNSVVQHSRGPGGDMNRKFANFDDSSIPGNPAAPGRDPDLAVVEILKSLIAESDLLVTMHDGSGFYRPEWESEQANPNRYGQCVIADADLFTHAPSGKKINLRETAEEVVQRVNREIPEPLHKFRFFNMRTAETDSQYKEHRLSATYYALTRFGVPAFCVEASKDLPSLDLKVRQHNLVVSAFLELAGLELEMPGVPDHSPALGYLVIAVNGGQPLAAANGNTLLIAPGDRVEILHISANRPSGLSAEIQGLTRPALFVKPVAVNKPTSIIVRKDNVVVGRVHIDFLPAEEIASASAGDAPASPGVSPGQAGVASGQIGVAPTPRVTGRGKIGPSYTARAAGPDSLPGGTLLAAAEAALRTDAHGVAGATGATGSTGGTATAAATGIAAGTAGTGAGTPSASAGLHADAMRPQTAGTTPASANPVGQGDTSGQTDGSAPAPSSTGTLTVAANDRSDAAGAKPETTGDKPNAASGPTSTAVAGLTDAPETGQTDTSESDPVDTSGAGRADAPADGRDGAGPPQTGAVADLGAAGNSAPPSGTRDTAGTQETPGTQGATGTQDGSAPQAAGATGTGTAPRNGEALPPGNVAAFLVEIDGIPVEIAPGEHLAVAHGAKVKIVDLKPANGPLPPKMVMNLRGFIAQTGANTGEDRGGVADTAELMPAFSEEKKGEVYAINADLGKKTLASCYLRIVKPELESVTVRFNGKTAVLKAWSRTAIPAGAPVEVLSVTLKDGLKPLRPRYTLAGKPVSAALPQTLIMRDIAINLAIFENGTLLGKVTWLPAR